MVTAALPVQSRSNRKKEKKCTQERCGNWAMVACYSVRPGDGIYMSGLVP